MKTGRFIVFEGIDGSGKSSCMQRVAEALGSRGVSVITTREPGGTPLAERIRGLLLEQHEENVDPLCELLLMQASRRQHYIQLICPKLWEGTWVLSDRFYDSSLCYQGLRCPKERIQTLNAWCVDGPKPDLVLVFDLPTHSADQRLSAALDRIETNTVDQRETLRACYRAVVRDNPAHYHLIDASQPSDDVFEQALTLISQVR